MPLPMAYRVLAELAAGASMSTAVDNATTHSLSGRPPIFGGLRLPPEAYNADGTLKVSTSCMCAAKVSA